MTGIAQIALPPKLIDVFAGDAFVRGAFGGRGSGKTMSFAKMTAVRAYIWDMAGREGVIVCGREFLNSIDDSSLAEVRAAIESEPWLAEHFDIGDKYIRTRSKRIQYKFSGLDKRTIMSLKSKAKMLLLWADEAEPITDASWDIILPTLRQEDSELWVTWNPARRSSATDLRFRQEKSDAMRVVEINWRDNPRFPAILERQRLEWLEKNPDSYDHVWEGAYATAAKGAYFTRQIKAMRDEKRLCRVGRDPNLKLRLFADIGGTGARSDAFAMWGAQFIGREVRVHDYYEAQGQEVGYHLQWMREHGYDGRNTEVYLPHDGATQDRVYAVSYESAFRQAGYSVTVVPNQGKGAAMARIQAARRMFASVWMHEENTTPGLEALAWYHEKWDDERNTGLGPDHDWSSHSADAFGLLAIVSETAMRVTVQRARDTYGGLRRRGGMAA
jgi:phage terminase large subunit